MAFIEIKNEEKNIYKILNLLRDEEFSVDVCNEILAKTNDFHVIKIMLDKINKLDLEEKNEYKEVIVSLFDGRVQRDEERNVALDIAKDCGYEKEIAEVIKETGDIGYLPKVGGSELLNPKNLYQVTRGADFEDVDFSSYNGIKVVEKIEEELVFDCSNGLKGILDFRGASIVNLIGCDLSNVTKIILGEGAKVCFDDVDGLPKNLDVSMCSDVRIMGCDLQGIDLRFRDGACILLEESSNITRDLDVSKCNSVALRDCDLSGINLAFRDGAVVDLFRATGLSRDLDVSMCSYINFGWWDLSEMNLKFRDGARVNFSLAKSLPESLDISMCEYVDLRAVSLLNLKSIKLKDRKQWANVEVYEHKMDSWEGEVIYVEKEKEFKLGNFLKNKIFGR